MKAKPTGTGDKPWQGRLVFWRGGHIWIGRVDSATGFHDHHAIQITLELAGDSLKLRQPDGDWIPYPASVIPAHLPHALEARDSLIALIAVEPESHCGQGLRARFHHGISSLAAEEVRSPAATLEALYQQGTADEELVASARNLIAQLAHVDLPPSRPLDSRIERAIATIRERLDQPVSLADIAGTVHLSPERFRHLFLQETGVRFRPYVLWLRLEVAATANTAGSSLTEASHLGGFADSAHFSRTFKRMLGVTPADFQHHVID